MLGENLFSTPATSSERRVQQREGEVFRTPARRKESSFLEKLAGKKSTEPTPESTPITSKKEAEDEKEEKTSLLQTLARPQCSDENSLKKTRRAREKKREKGEGRTRRRGLVPRHTPRVLAPPERLPPLLGNSTEEKSFSQKVLGSHGRSNGWVFFFTEERYDN